MKLDKNSTSVSKKQKRIVTKHIKGDSNVEIGKEEYPKATTKSQRQIVYQELNKPAVRQYMEQAKLQAMKEHNIGWHRVMKVIDKGLDATKTDNSGAPIDDMGTQLRAAKQASDYLEMPKDIKEEAQELIGNLPSNVDEIQLVRILNR